MVMIRTNKDSLITLAVQGEIVPAQIERRYEATWDGRAKLCIGVGGINYNLKIGSKVFGWVNGDRAEPGVCTDNTGSASQKNGYRTKASLGNEAKLLSGEAKGERGVVVGKHGYQLPGGAHHVLLHFGDETVERLAIGDKILVKACGIGLEIEGYEDVLVRSLGPRLLESMGIEEKGGKLHVPAVKEIPHTLMGEGWGTGAHSSHIGIQTCYEPDIAAHGLDELRFGDVVFLGDILSDWGRHYYRGGSSIGVVVSGPSDVSGRGIGVCTILSSKEGRLEPSINADANIGSYLGLIGG
jgi:hypothetical protein